MTLITVLWNVKQMPLLRTFQMMALKEQCLCFCVIVMEKDVLFFLEIALSQGDTAIHFRSRNIRTCRRGWGCGLFRKYVTLYDSLYSTSQVENRKIRMDIKAVKNMLESSEINRVDCVEGSQQLFECLIKKGLNTKYTPRGKSQAWRRSATT